MGYVTVCSFWEMMGTEKLDAIAAGIAYLLRKELAYKRVSLAGYENSALKDEEKESLRITIGKEIQEIERILEGLRG